MKKGKKMIKTLTSVKYLVVHCSASPPSVDADATMIDRWHRERGFLKIGYHYVIKRDGTVEPGRDETHVGAHEPRVNQVSVAICMVGGVNAQGKAEANFTDAQFVSLERLLTELRGRYPGAEILGHRDIPGVRKDCPSFNVQQWWAGRQRGADV